jgi:hypothetical protein
LSPGTQKSAVTPPLLRAREELVKHLEKQTKQIIIIINTSNSKFENINVGTTIPIPIPDIDRTHLDRLEMY